MTLTERTYEMVVRMRATGHYPWKFVVSDDIRVGSDGRIAANGVPPLRIWGVQVEVDETLPFNSIILRPPE